VLGGRGKDILLALLGLSPSLLECPSRLLLQGPDSVLAVLDLDPGLHEGVIGVLLGCLQLLLKSIDQAQGSVPLGPEYIALGLEIDEALTNVLQRAQDGLRKGFEVREPRFYSTTQIKALAKRAI